MRKKLLLGLFALLFTSISIFAQTTATGKVVDEKGAAISGASVLEKGTKNGTTTASDGSYSLKVKDGATLVIKAIGFSEYEVKASNNSHIAMLPDSKSLTEVVVTGIGTATSKKKVAIDVASVSSKDFAKSAVASIEQGIMGQVAGAQIQQTSGQPNSGYNIILRGINALGGTQPMILLDGVEVTNLSDIDPAIVERVEVVKGAAAGQLYGPAGANGVIQVFSKRGSKGKTSVRISTKFGWDNVLIGKEISAKYHHYNTDAQGYILTGGGTRVGPNSVGEWSDPSEDLTVDSKNDKPFVEKTYDHLAQSFKQALTNTTSINISGGGEKVDYSFTASYLKQEDVYSNKFRRLNLGLNIGMDLFKGFTLRSITNVFMSEDNLLTSPNSRFGMINSFPFIDFTWRDSIGHLVMKPRKENQHNPLSEAEWHQNSVKPININQSFNITYKLPRFVTLDYKLGVTKTMTNTFDYYLNQESALQTSLPWGSSIRGSITEGNQKRTYLNSLFTATTNFDFEKDFKVNLPIKSTTLLAYDYRKNDYHRFDVTGAGLPAFPPYNLTLSDSKSAFSESSTFVSYGVLATQSFDYGTLFGISGGFRSDKSSNFGAGAPKTFARATAYIHPSEWINSTVLADWKIRFAYGSAGIQPETYSNQITLATAQLGTAVSLLNQDPAKNNLLRVQVSKETEIGTDVVLRRANSIWFNKVSLAATYWTRKGEDIIQKADLPVSGGYSTVIDNLTSINSKGFDISLDIAVLERKNFSWNFGYRMGFAKSTVEKIANHQPVISGSFTLAEGHDVGEMYGQYALKDINGLKADGVTPYIAAADQKFYTSVNGYIVDTRTNAPVISGADDLKAFGSAYPKFTASFINSFTIRKNWEVSFQLDWYKGNKIYNMTRQWMYRDRISKDFDNAVTIGSKTGAFVNYYNGFYNTISPVDYFAEDGSFMRLRNLSITYNIPLSKVKFIKDAQVTFAARNLFTITNYSGLDPENTTSVDNQGNDISKNVGGFKGVDYFGVPNTRSFQIGINLGF